MSNEEDGSTAPTADGAALADTVIDADPRTSLDTKAVHPGLKPFAKGHDPRRNTAGRPPKGETLGEKYVKRLEKDADALIEAHVRRAKGDNVVAERAFTTALAYAVGLPKQTFVMQRGDDPYMALMAEIAAAGGMRELPAPTDNDA